MTKHKLKNLRRQLSKLERIPVEDRTSDQKIEVASIKLKIQQIEERYSK